MKLHPQAQGTLALGVYQDDLHTIDKKRSEEAGIIGQKIASLSKSAWYDEADEWIRYHMAQRFTADDIVGDIGLPMDLDHYALCNNGIGAYLNKLAHRKPPIIRAVGYCKSSRVSSHGRVLRIWIVEGRP